MSDSYSVRAILSAKDDNFTSTFDKAQGVADGFASRLGSGLGFGILMEAGRQAFNMIENGFKSAINAGMGFETAMSQVAATLGYSSDELASNTDGARDNMEALEAKAREMGASTQYTAAQAAEGLNILAQSGYDATNSIEMIEDVLHLAAAGGMDMGAAAGYVATTMKGFNDETKDSGYYANLMAKGANLANTSVEQLGEAMSSGAAGAKAYNQSADSMTVSLLRLAEQGETGSAAGTALAAVMRDLYTPTDQAAEAMKKLGVSAYDPETGEYREFNAVVNDLDAALNEVGSDGLPKYTDEQKAALKQTIFGRQGLDAYNKMVVTGTEKQEEWTEALAHASDGAGAASEMYDAMTDNLQGDITTMGSALESLGISIYENFQEPMRSAVQTVTGLIGSADESIQSLSEAFKEGGLAGALKEAGSLLNNLPDGFKMVGAAGAAGLTTILTSKFFDSGIWNNVKKGMGGSLNIMKSLPGKVGKAFSEAGNTMRNFPGVLTKLSGTLDDVQGKFGSFAGSLTSKFPKLSGALGKFGGVAGKIGGTTAKVFGTMGQGLTKMMGLALKSLMPAALIGVALAGLGLLYSKFGDQIDQMLQVAQEKGPGIITGLANGIASKLPELISKGAQLVEGLLNTLTANLPALIAGGGQIIMALVDGVAAALPTLIPTAAMTVMTLVSSIVTMIPDLITTGMNLLQGLAQGVVNALPIIIGEGINAVLGFIQGMTDNFPTILQTAASIIITLVNGIVQNLPMLITGAIQCIVALVSGFIQNLPVIIQTGIQVIGALASGIITAFIELVKGIPQMFMSLGEAILSVDWLDVGSQILQAIGGGIASGIGWLGDKIGGLLGGGEVQTNASEAGNEAGSAVVSGVGSQVSASNVDYSTLFTGVDTESAAALVPLQSNTDEWLSTIDTSGTEMQTSVEGTWDLINNTMNSEGSTSISIAGNTADGIVSELDGAQDGAYDAGRNIGAGLANGMESMEGRVWAAAHSIAEAAEEAIRAAAQVQSPSKVTTRIGEYWGEGFINGIQSMMREAWEASSEMVSIPRLPSFRMSNISEPKESTHAGGGEYVIVVPVNLDGRQIAEVTAPFTEDLMARRSRNSMRKAGIA